ncbi:MAG: AAA family ATPase, partial [Prochloraceae cyanobacterium]
QKLYGRDREIKILLKLFYKTRQGISQYLLISGDSGVGKSALIKEIYKPVTEVKGYFITGKFDQYQINTPYSAIVEALQDLVKHLLTENNAKFNEWQKKITTALGVNGKVITNVIPELELIIGKQAQVPQLNPHENQNRFNLVFLNFIQVFTQREHPFILFVDDLQWADQASLKLIDLLITSDLKYFFLIGTYRDKEINLTERLTLTLEKIKEHKVIEQIHLSLLNLNQLNYLLADTLKSPLEKVKNLAKLILLKTAGNPFFIKEFLHSLYSEKLLYFNYSYCCWDWDLDEITKKNVTNNVVNLLSKKIQKLDPDSINLLKYAACLGNQYELKDLSIFIGKSEQDTNSILNRLRISGLILPIVETFKTIESINTSNNISDKKILYKFIHDRVQQVAYSLISKENKPILHLKLGRLLKQNTCSTLIDSKVFEIVKQLNLGIEVIDSRSELDELASLNLIAGKKAKSTAAYKSALKYFQLALKLLGKESWDRQYSLTLSIHLEAAEASYSSAEFYFMDILLNKVIQQGKQLQDKVKAYEIQIEAYAARNKLSEALKIGLSVLKQLGIKIPSHPSRVNIWLEFILIKLTKVKYLNKDLMQLPKMSDSNKLAAMKILEVLTSAAYFASPSTYTFIVLKRFNLILKYGNFCGSPVVYGDYGLILCGRFNQINSGYQFCRFALDFLLKLQLKEYEAKTLLRLNWIGHFKESFQKIEPMFFEGYQKGLETGDLVYATTSLFLINCNSYLTGRNLKELKKQIEKHQIIIEQTKQKRVLNYLKVYHQIVFDLLNSKITLPYFLSGKYCEEESVYNDFLLVNDRSGIFILYINKAIICYIFKDYEQAQINLAKARKDLESVNGMPLVPIFYFYDSLTRIALIETKNFYLRQKDFLTIIANQRKMKHWADSAPMNYKHKYDLVAAEVHRIKGNKDKAANLYESAILGAKKYKYVNEEALAYELTANFYFKINKIILAEAHIKEAYYNYKFWGAEAKVNYLQEKHSNLLLNGRIFKCISEKSTNISTTISSKLSYLDNLDLALIFETNKLLSGELDLKKLLEKIIKTVIENSCAQKGCLILPTQAETNKLRIEAFANLGGSEVTTLKSIPLDWVDPKLETTFVPVTIVNYVARKQEAVILDNAVKEQRYAKDPYIKATQLKSVLCIPLLNQATLIGLIYLENNLITGAFTSERVRFIEAIGSQAAISIQNAEAKEKLKTAKLELEEFLEAVPIGVFIADAKANPYYTNSAAKKILGNSTVSTQSVSELTKDCELYDESGNIYKDNHPIAQALKGKNIIGLDVQAEISQNKRIPLEINATPVFNRKGDLVYAIAAFQDISDRKKAKKTLEAKNAELESTKKLLEKTNQQLERQNAQLQEQLEKIESLSFKNALQQALLKDANRNNFEYQLGGTLAPDAPTYVVREADITLYRSLIKSQFCYIFNARQMGKSSMQVKIAAQLKSEGYNCISLDLSEFVNERISTATFYSC